MKERVGSDITLATTKLSEAISYQGYVGQMMASAKGLLGIARGQVATIIVTHPDYSKMKETMIRAAMDGLLYRFNAWYEHAERTSKSLDKYIDGLRSVVSSEKEQYIKSHSNG